jgi:UDP-2-acetamido-2-deoxy-ribo-hexuluronate aminotransferase
MGSTSVIPYLDLKPQYKALEKSINARIQTVLEHGQFILGPEVEECEAALAKYLGVKHALTCASGTDALMVALMGLEVGPGDEVITTPFSFFATAEVISLVGATPVFVDIDPVTYNLDPAKIEAAITPKTKVIMPVSLYGQPADFDEINAIGCKHGISVVEDSAQSFGAKYNNQRSGALGRVSGTSFFPAKPLGCYGDGGAVFTNDDALAAVMKQIRVHGQEKRYHHVRMGINGRLDTLQCAVLIEKLKRYDWEIAQRNRIAATYTAEFAKLGDDLIRTPYVKPDRESVWAQYTVLVKDREQFAKKLAERGVPTSVHYPTPLHWQPVYAELRNKYHVPVAETVSQQVISLPLYPDMAESVQEQIIETVKAVLKV